LVAAVGEISVAYFHETNNPERTAQIDTIGWVFVAFVVAAGAIAALAVYGYGCL
jgi:hypothetical protein